MTNGVWFGWQEATVRFNEARVDGWITQPVNTWTNLAYIVVGIALLVWILNRQPEQRKSLILMLPIGAILVGISSFLYHASSSFFFQVFDLSSMFLLSSFLLTKCLSRNRFLSANREWIAYLVFFILSVGGVLIIRGNSGEFIFGGEVAAVLGLEAAYCIRFPAQTKYRDFLIALGLFMLAWGIWLLDVNHLFFDPNNHFVQGHAIWHIVNSLCYVFLYRFYSRIESEA